MLLCCSVGKIFIYIGAPSLNPPFLSFPSFYFFCFETQLYTEPIPLRLYLNCNLPHKHIDIPLGSGHFLTTGVVVKFCMDAQHIFWPPRKSRAIGIFSCAPLTRSPTFVDPTLWSIVMRNIFYAVKGWNIFDFPKRGWNILTPPNRGRNFVDPPCRPSPVKKGPLP